MSDDRRTLLKRKAHRPLVSAFAKLVARPRVAAIDVEMFWPPDHDAIHFRVEADKRDVDWNFSIPTKHWRLTTDSNGEFPDELYPEIKHLFRAAWKEASANAKGPRAYLRFHDSTSSVDLATGREIWDRDRPDSSTLDQFLAVREEAELTQRELGDRLKKPQSWIYNCETGNRRVDVTEFIAWARACEVDPERALARLLDLL